MHNFKVIVTEQISEDGKSLERKENTNIIANMQNYLISAWSILKCLRL